ncbi:hypothetical protein [uncultured Sulfitobacter sp.]|uniref:TRAP transporter small permease subunit n=1 Tax=uncultured Sulfitobacter sp. TaxID=191468 RepID=UPI00262E86DF|nr:hypothetical protein [uncultured Sulfitobacter sp.]
MGLLSFTTIVLRYVYGNSNSAIILAASARYTRPHNAHVRVDILHGAMSERGKDLVGVLGGVFPVLCAIWGKGQPFVARSWALGETSNKVAGVEYMFLLKTFILVLAVQGVSFTLRKLHILIYGTPTLSGWRQWSEITCKRHF